MILFHTHLVKKDTVGIQSHDTMQTQDSVSYTFSEEK